MKNQKKTNSAGFKKALSIVILGGVCLTAAVSVSSLSKTVTVTDGNETIKINTITPDTQSVLSRTGIELGENDKLVRTDDDKKGVNISVIRAFDVDKTEEPSFNETSVADSMLSAGMTLSDNESISLAAALENSGSETEIKLSRYEITVDVRGEKVTKYVPAGTIKNALDFLGIELASNDIISEDINKSVKDGLEIEIKRVEYKTITQYSAIEYDTIYKDTDDLYEGETEVETEGAEGQRTVTTKEKYVNGELVSTEEVSNVVTKEAVDEVILKGTKEKEVQTYDYTYNYSESGHLTNMSGIYYGPSGLETYYNLPMDGVVSVMRNMGFDADEYPYWVRDDGCKMLGGYIMVAADLSIRPRGSLVPTSLGTGIVCDTGGFIYNNPYQLDIATAW